MVTSSHIVRWGLLICAALGASRAAAVAAEQPNVIVVVIDDLGWADLQCYGSRFHRTPQLDRLAREGLRMTSAYAACPVCSPTRAALMTGRYPARLHLTDWLPGRPDRPDQRLLRPAFRQELPLEEVTLAELLAQAGYETAHVGKWHLGGEGFEPTRQGFALNVAGDVTGSPLSYFAPYERDGRTMPGLAAAPAGEYLTDRLFAEAVRFIETPRERPFFLYLPHYAVHTPLRAPDEAVAEFADTPPHGQQRNPVYAAMLARVDAGVGQVLDKLSALELAEQTLIVFTSDNGGLATTEGPSTPATNNAPLREGKGWLYEGGLRVPFIVHWPGHIPAGGESGEPISSIDLLPTVAEVCGLASPTDCDGVSFAQHLAGGEPPAREALFWHYPHYSNQGGRPGGAIRRGSYKLIEYYEQGRRELYNVVADPSETRNLTAAEPDLTADLARQLAEWRVAVGAQEMAPNPDYTPNPQQAEGQVVLRASTAQVHGLQLRYEPLPHKNTLGFWTDADDWAQWEFELTTPGTFRVYVLTGCGHGSGDSQVELTVGQQTLAWTVEETGGFQDFVEREVGTLELDRPGRYELAIRARQKPGLAVMDLRQIRLVPVPSATAPPEERP